jgi:hypothetical protein
MALLATLLALHLAAATDSVKISDSTAKVDTVLSAQPVAVAPGPAAVLDTATSVQAPVPSTATIVAPAVEAAPQPGPAPTLPTVPVAAPVPGPVGPVVGPVQIPAASAFGPVGPVGPVAGPVTMGTTTMVGIDTSGSGTSGRSTVAAVGLSLLVPGWGHRYLGYTSRSTAYFATDLVGWVALFGAWMTGKAAVTNAAEIANRYAGAQLGTDPNENLLSVMRTYRSRRQTGGRHDSYNEAMILSDQNPESQFPDDDAHNWDWGSRENPDNDAHIRSFENQLRLWRGTRVALYSTAGALAVVRVVAAMDVLRLTRSAASRAGISLDTRPLPGGMDATLAVNF